jgi:hypothetical protein
MLHYNLSCMIPGGCGPTITILDSNLEEEIPLVGFINPLDSQTIVSLKSVPIVWIFPSYNSIPTISPGMLVLSYKTKSNIPYHKFLVDRGGEYTQKQYPCLISEIMPERLGTKWNKTLSWELNKDMPVLKVRMTDTEGIKSRKEIDSARYYELWYNGNDGKFIKELNNFSNPNLCADTYN